MTIEHVEVLVEEPSMEAALSILLPKLIGEISFRIYTHQSKQYLLQHLPKRLRGYSAWLPENWRIVVVVDRDNDDCDELKKRLEALAAAVGLKTRTTDGASACSVINRIAIEELEAWYFGDWSAVCAAYPRVPAGIPGKAPFRNPDAIVGGTWESFERVMRMAGYFQGGLRKIEAARTITPHMDLEANSSSSFNALRLALVELTEIT